MPLTNAIMRRIQTRNTRSPFDSVNKLGIDPATSGSGQLADLVQPQRSDSKGDEDTVSQDQVKPPSQQHQSSMNGRAPPRKGKPIMIIVFQSYRLNVDAFDLPFPGENFELRAELNSEYRDRRADAIKRVIANMTVGKDVSGLFPDVLKNMVSFKAI